MKNAYERRKLHRDLLRKARTEESRFVKILEIEGRIRAYEQAHKDYYKVIHTVNYENGWYWVHNKRVRASELERMTNQLLVLQHERYLQEVANEPVES